MLAELSLSLEGIAALAALGFTLLTCMCGGAWWASAMYSRVGQLINEVRAGNQNLNQFTAHQDRVNSEVFETLGVHGERIAKVESKIENRY